jgi:ATP-dependent DNA helicase MPH1
MLGIDDGVCDYLDDDLDDFVAHDDDSPRSPKRRRLSDQKTAGSARRESVGDDDKSDDYGPGFDSDGENNVDEPSSAEEAPYLFPDQQKSKYKVFVPKQTTIRENMFVTQLTQPASPPERIRGPRWKKPDSNPPVIHSATGIVAGHRTCEQPQVQNRLDGSDDDLKAAIEASLQSFEEESSKPMVSLAREDSNVSSLPASDTADLFDDIPDDAFDSDLSLSPPANTAPQVPWKTSQSRSLPLGVRQTTLYDMAPRNPATQPVPGEQVFFPPEKVERPTHHKLNRDKLDTWVFPTNLGRTRDYQFNISQRGLFHNTLVALPTGLGKTFIAATIMLNWFRWTQDAQIVFVAPTKPLVSQQISACYQIAGIPRSQTTMLTGDAPPGVRAEEWRTRRVFFMTPQTLTNDLKSGIADPKRIVLLVVDEAHRATGRYAYVEVVKFLRRFNQSFRVLALTATPGSNIESVQAVIDGLEISKVEIRTEQSLDIREYVHARHTDVQTFQNSDEMIVCMDLLSSTLNPLVDQLRELNAFWGRDAMSLTPFGLTKARQQWMASDAGRNANLGLKGKVMAIFTVLASMAHGIDLLKYHGITPLYRHLTHFQSGSDGQKKGKYHRQIVQDEHFVKLLNYLGPWSKNPEFIGHPKLGYLKQVVLNHFLDAGEQSATRVMIFVHFRDSAEEVTRVLKRHEPMIRPHVFVGQSSAKGSEGMGQKTQLDIIQKFKNGTYNTIVATSIGEEGLDIGEVDLIVCYDASASPIRMLQRMGRTGRKRAGNIVLLLMQGKEEENYLKARDNYEKMQELIASGTQFSFHDKISPRILPAGIKPIPDKRQIEIPEENATGDLPEPKKRKGRLPKRPPKQFHMPDNVETGFTKASRLGETAKLKAKAKAKSKPKPRAPTPEPVPVPDLAEVLLTSAQQNDLERHYQDIGGTTPQFIRYPRSDAFPRLQLVQRPTKLVKHGSLTRRVIGALQRMNQVTPDCEERFKEVLARETEFLYEDSAVFSIPRTSEDSQTSQYPRPKTIRPDRLQETENLVESDSDAEPPSPSKLFSVLNSPRRSKPFHPPRRVSQIVTAVDDFLDLPDPETFNTPGRTQTLSRKRRRIVIDDDSDE